MALRPVRSAPRGGRPALRHRPGDPRHHRAGAGAPGAQRDQDLGPGGARRPARGPGAPGHARAGAAVRRRARRGGGCEDTAISAWRRVAGDRGAGPGMDRGRRRGGGRCGRRGCCGGRRGGSPVRSSAVVRLLPQGRVGPVRKRVRALCLPARRSGRALALAHRFPAARRDRRRTGDAGPGVHDRDLRRISPRRPGRGARRDRGDLSPRLRVRGGQRAARSPPAPLGDRRRLPRRRERRVARPHGSGDLAAGARRDRGSRDVAAGRDERARLAAVPRELGMAGAGRGAVRPPVTFDSLGRRRGPPAARLTRRGRAWRSPSAGPACRRTRRRIPACWPPRH